MGRHTVWCGRICWEEIDADLSLLNRTLCCLFNRLPERCDVWILVCGGKDGLNKELVSAFCICGRLFFHRLKQDYDG